MFTVYALYSHAIKKMTEKPKLKEEGLIYLFNDFLVYYKLE